MPNANQPWLCPSKRKNDIVLAMSVVAHFMRGDAMGCNHYFHHCSHEYIDSIDRSLFGSVLTVR
jgi:hypothetical protein